jgi:hypothetical protein
MTAFYDPRNWYWSVTNQSNAIYSSASNTYVDVSDQTYSDWIAAGNAAIPIPDEAELWGVVSPNGLPAWLFDGTHFVQPAVGQYTKTQLASYSANARANHAGGGVIVTSLSPVPFLSDPVARNTLANAYEYIKATPGSTVNWKLSDGSFININEAALQKATTSVASFVQSCFTCESDTLTSINGASITTLAAIDAAYAAVTNVFP